MNNKPSCLRVIKQTFALKEHLKKFLTEKGISYADFAHPLAAAIKQKECYPGIAICYTGNGISMTLNKHQQIRVIM